MEDPYLHVCLCCCADYTNNSNTVEPHHGEIHTKHLFHFSDLIHQRLGDV